MSLDDDPSDAITNICEDGVPSNDYRHTHLSVADQKRLRASTVTHTGSRQNKALQTMHESFQSMYRSAILGEDRNNAARAYA